VHHNTSDEALLLEWRDAPVCIGNASVIAVVPIHAGHRRANFRQKSSNF
jgi:hypothetical protein